MQMRRSASTSSKTTLQVLNRPTNAQIPLPNSRPEHVSERLDRLIGSNRLVRCIFYGVQDATRSSTVETTLPTKTSEEISTIQATTETIIQQAMQSRLLPNTPPAHLNLHLQRIISRSQILKCIVYGVHENVDSTQPKANPSQSKPSIVGVPQTSVAQVTAPPLPVNLRRVIFKDLEIATATLTMGGCQAPADVPTWY